MTDVHSSEQSHKPYIARNYNFRATFSATHHTVCRHSKLCWGLSQTHEWCNSALLPFKVIQCNWILYQQKAHMWIPISNLGLILQPSRDTAKNWQFCWPNLIICKLR